MSDRSATTGYVGQVECDPAGTLWAVLYFRDHVIERERVRSLRHGKRRVTNMVLAAHDSCPDVPRRPAPVALNRVQVERRSSPRRRHAAISQLTAPG
jgi:hypothetical protein